MAGSLVDVSRNHNTHEQLTFHVEPALLVSVPPEGTGGHDQPEDSVNRYTTTNTETGETATRNSQNRTYTHAVWAQEPAALIQARLEHNLARLEAEAARYEAVIAGTEPVDSKYLSIDDFPKFLADIQPRIADIRAKLAAGVGDGHWYCDGWCGRPDLADKKAAGLRKNGYRAFITEAVAA